MSRNTQSGDWKTYEDLVQKYLPGPDVDDVAPNEYMNGIDTMVSKVEYAWRIGLGGVMIWEVFPIRTILNPCIQFLLGFSCARWAKIVVFTL